MKSIFTSCVSWLVAISAVLTLAGSTAADVASLPHPASATTNASVLSLDRIFAANEFKEERLALLHWSKRTSDYFTLDPPLTGGAGRDLVRNDPATGRKEVVVLAQVFVPAGETAPLAVDGCEFSTALRYDLPGTLHGAAQR